MKTTNATTQSINEIWAKADTIRAYAAKIVALSAEIEKGLTNMATPAPVPVVPMKRTCKRVTVTESTWA